jgi:hypothetical protein
MTVDYYSYLEIVIKKEGETDCKDNDKNEGTVGYSRHGNGDKRKEWQKSKYPSCLKL